VGPFPNDEQCADVRHDPLSISRRSLLTGESAAMPEEIPMVLGFESGNAFNAEQWRIIREAYRRGRERAKNLGAHPQNHRERREGG
jgi:hypothetical protein